MQYRRIQYWIEWQAKKYGMTVEYVPAFNSFVTYPKCGKKMKEQTIVGFPVRAVMRTIVTLSLS